MRALFKKSRMGCAGAGVLAAEDGGSGVGLSCVPGVALAESGTESKGSGSGGNGSLGGI